jgi:hypothetical protein
MEKGEFDLLFHSTVTASLTRAAFNEKGKSLFYDDGITNVSLLRLGGRMASPGTIAHVLCFRHSILPDLEERTPQGFVSNAFAYPYKFTPSELFNTSSAAWTYRPQNLNYAYDSYSFRDQSSAEVTHYLGRLTDLVGSQFLSWAKRLSPVDSAEQISKSGESVWCEKLWLKAYASNPNG